MSLLEQIEHGPVLGDGAMGTLLLAEGAGPCLEALCMEDPDRITRIHTAYAEAGARIVRTNSFGANAIRLAAHGLDRHVNEINWQAAQIARQAVKGRGITVAGSVGPIGDDSLPREQRAGIFREQLGALLDGGAQMIFFETFQDLDELLLALEVKYSLHHCPAVCSLAINAQGMLPDGTSLANAFRLLEKNDAEIAGINCTNGPAVATALLESGLPTKLPLSVFPNAGLPDPETLQYHLSPSDFASACETLIQLGAKIVGGCCGTTPAHIAAATARLWPS